MVAHECHSKIFNKLKLKFVFIMKLKFVFIMELKLKFVFMMKLKFVFILNEIEICFHIK